LATARLGDVTTAGTCTADGVGEVTALGFTGLVGNPAGASPRASSESKPPVSTK
jgi:hypothetical protein